MNLVAFNTLFSSQLLRLVRIWRQSFLPPVITFTLFFIVFGTLGRRIELIEGRSYMQFLAPGLIMLYVITNSYASVGSAFFITKFMRSIEELLISPMRPGEMILGYVLAGVTRGLLISVFLYIVALFFTSLPITHLLLAFLLLILTSLCFSLFGFVNALWARKFDEIMMIPDFVLTPLTYLGGVFYAIDELPPTLRMISNFNPIAHIVQGFRFAFFGGEGSIWPALIVLFAFNIALYILATTLIKKRIGLRV